MFCNVIVTRPFDQVFTYKLKKDQKAKVGNIVLVPFGKSNKQIGMIDSISKIKETKDTFKIKEVEKIYESIILNKKIIKFIFWISNYTLSPVGLVLKLFLINEKILDFSKAENKENLLIADTVQLNSDQQDAVNIIKKSLNQSSSPIVLEGVTGSGKTEVFFEAIELIIIKKNKA